MATWTLIDELIADTTNIDVPVYFDMASFDGFQIWSNYKTKEYRELKKRIADGLKLIVFEEQLNSIYPDALDDPDDSESEADEEADEAPRTPHPVIAVLDELKVEYVSDRWNTRNDMYAAEVQDIYFDDSQSTGRASNHAKFFILARYANHRSRENEPLRILTIHPAFLKVKNAQVIMLDKPVGGVLPVDFDVFADLNIHQQLWNASKQQFEAGDYPASMLQASLELLDYLRTTTNVSGDGATLINNTLKIETQYRNPNLVIKPGTPPPPYPLNGLRDGNEIGEHAAYYYFVLGCNQLIRNAMAHNRAQEPFIQRRFGKGKENKVIKLLAFLSLLFEKLDESKAHHP